MIENDRTFSFVNCQVKTPDTGIDLYEDLRDMMDEFLDYWNSNQRRNICPDVISINFSFITTPIVGQGQNFAINLFTREPDAGIHITTTPTIRRGFNGRNRC